MRAVASGALAEVRTVLDASPNAVIGVDERGVVIYANDRMETDFGYPPEELIGRPVEVLLPDRLAAGHVRTRTAFIENPTARPMGFGLDLTARRKNGTEFPVEISLLPVTTQHGRWVCATIVDITARKLAQEALAASERRFRAVLDGSPDAIVGIDAAGAIIYANPRVQASFGYRPEELVGKPIETLLPLDLAEPHIRHRTAFLRDPVPRSMGIGMQLAGRRKDGSEFPVEIGLAPVETDSGYSVFATVADITERKAAEARIAEAEQLESEALRASEERFTAFMDASPALAWIKDADGRYVYVNHSWEHAFGVEHGTPLGKTVFDLVPESGRRVTESDIAALRGDGPAAAVQDTEELSGTRRSWDTFKFPFSGAGGQQLLGGIAIDVTERKRAEDELARRAELTRRMEGLANVGAWEIDVPSMRLTWSDGIYRILDVDPGVVSDMATGFSFFPPEVRPVMQATIQAAIDSGTSWDLETPMITGNGRMIWGRSIGKAVMRDGVVMQLVGAFQDVTEVRQARDEVETLNRELERRVSQRTAALENANKELESFSYSVSHDLRAPVRAISGFSQILARRHRDSLNEQGQHFLDNIVTASGRMGMLIEDLLGYSRLGRGVVPTDPVPLAPITQRLTEVFRERAASIGAQLEVITPLATPRGDPTLIEQILTNLIDNALTYHRRDATPRIRVTAARIGDEVIVEVADNGIGIEPQYQDQIFEMFQRLHSEEEYPGTGIGLATVRKAAERMAGAVTVESTAGVGTTFTVRLPAADETDHPR